MRSNTTDRMATAMNRAFDKSGMTLKEFIAHLKATRDILDYEENDDYLSFQIIKDGQLYEFYFAFDMWGCKQ